MMPSLISYQSGTHAENIKSKGYPSVVKRTKTNQYGSQSAAVSAFRALNDWYRGYTTPARVERSAKL